MLSEMAILLWPINVDQLVDAMDLEFMGSVGAAQTETQVTTAGVFQFTSHFNSTSVASTEGQSIKRNEVVVDVQ